MLFQGLWGLGVGGGAVDVLHRLGPGDHSAPTGNSDTYLSRGSMVKALMSVMHGVQLWMLMGERRLLPGLWNFTVQGQSGSKLW